MQFFSKEPEKKQEEIKTDSGFVVKVVKAASLDFGTHSVRFWPLSPDFYKEGADYYNIVQYFHWLNRQPVICRRYSWNYDVADTAPKHRIDTECPLCEIKINSYTEAKALYAGDPEKERLYKIGKTLQEGVAASSIVSFKEPNGKLSPPVILRYSKELLDCLDQNVESIFKATNINICDPVKGYMFDIIVSKNNKGHRSYKLSMPEVTRSPVDISGAPWDWKEISLAIKTELKPIVSAEELEKVWDNYKRKNNSAGRFSSPPGQQVGYANSNNPGNNGGRSSVNNPHNNTQVHQEPVNAGNPDIGFNTNNSGSVNTPVNQESGNAGNTGQSAVSTNVNLPGCHSLTPGGSGYEESDVNCQPCQSKETCKQNKAPFVNQNQAEQVINVPATQFDVKDVDKRIAELNGRVNPGNNSAN
jgi:hypothetical protein